MMQDKQTDTLTQTHQLTTYSHTTDTLT